MGDLSPYLGYLAKGVLVTLEVSLLASLLALMIAFALGLGRLSQRRLVRLPVGVVVEVFRGTSAVVQLFWAFYVLPDLGVKLTPLEAGVIVLALNEGSYASEIVRAAIKAVPRAQVEAAIALGLSPWHRFRRVVLPQAIPIMLPSFGNELISMVKFTSLVSLVTIQELTFRAGSVRSATNESATVYGLTLLVYFAISLLLSAFARLLERRASIEGRARSRHGDVAPRGWISRLPRLLVGGSR